MKTSYHGIEKCTNLYEAMTVSDLCHDAFKTDFTGYFTGSSLACSYKL